MKDTNVPTPTIAPTSEALKMLSKTALYVAVADNAPVS